FVLRHGAERRVDQGGQRPARGPAHVGRRGAEPTLLLRCVLQPHQGRTAPLATEDRKSTRLNSSHVKISYAVFCLKKKKKTHTSTSQIPLTTPSTIETTTSETSTTTLIISGSHSSTRE